MNSYFPVTSEGVRPLSQAGPDLQSARFEQLRGGARSRCRIPSPAPSAVARFAIPVRTTLLAATRLAVTSCWLLAVNTPVAATGGTSPAVARPRTGRPQAAVLACQPALASPVRQRAGASSV